MDQTQNSNQNEMSSIPGYCVSFPVVWFCSTDFPQYMQADHVQANMMRDLKSIMGVSWKIKIVNVRKIVELYQ